MMIVMVMKYEASLYIMMITTGGTGHQSCWLETPSTALRWMSGPSVIFAITSKRIFVEPQLNPN